MFGKPKPTCGTCRFGIPHPTDPVLLCRGLPPTPEFVPGEGGGRLVSRNPPVMAFEVACSLYQYTKEPKAIVTTAKV